MLVGDGGSAALPYMLTPLNRQQSGPERAYNLAHARTRGVIERTFGVMKKIFPCLHFGLRLKLTTVFAVIPAIAASLGYLEESTRDLRN